MSYSLESFTRQDGLTLLRFAKEGIASVLEHCEMCAWHGGDCLAAVKNEDVPRVVKTLDTLLVEKKNGYTRFLFDGYGLHSVAPLAEALLSPWGLAVLSVSDIRMAALLPTERADDASMTLWAYFSPVIEML